LRYIGDVLLATPLALSIKERYPEARVDFLVFAGTEGILAKNPCVDAVHVIPPGSRRLGLLARIWRRYDFAIGANTSDRTTIFTAAAGRTSIGFSYFSRKEWWKKLLLDTCRLCDDRLHIVPLILTQLETLGIPPRPRVVMGYDPTDEEFARRHIGEGEYVILHPYTRRPCKQWTPAGWGALAALIRETGSKAVFTVSPAPTDRLLLDEILAQAPAATSFFHAPYSFNQLAAAIRGSCGFVGVDTVVTHLAAALDVPTVALYGPTLTRHWGPWPNDSPELAPYDSQGAVQRVGRITVIQKEWPCVPCNRESCASSERGRIECLAAISPGEVFSELERVMAVAR
jgi:heptosyltransferase-3